MDNQTAKHIFDQLLASKLTDLRSQVLKAAVRYAQFRANWFLMTSEERKKADDPRTAAHNAFIDSLNILSRNAAKAGEDNEWRRALPQDRRGLGDFACHVACFMGLESR